ncbi:MBL fold metallo-hydrolase, partial [Neisseria meningitidis]
IPGHTPGHIVFYCAEAELLIAGDVLFYETIGRTDFPRGNHADLINNIRNKLFALPETVQVVAGHGRMTSIGHEKRHNPFF